MRFMLDAVYIFVMLAVSPWLLYKSLTTGKYRRGLWAKISGRTISPRYLPATSSPRHCAWFHGVSVGEVHLLRQVVKRFRERHPDWDCVISTTTDTGFDEAKGAFAGLAVVFWPLDFSWAVRRALAAIRPSLIVLAEGELWPNFLRAAKSRRIPIAVLNGRVSPRSLRRHRRLALLSRPLFARLDLVAAQTEDYAAAYRELGARTERVHVAGSVKFDGVTADRQHPRTLSFGRLLDVRPEDRILIAGSTQAPEEECAIEIFRKLRTTHPDLRLVIVPRQKDRFGEVADLLQSSGLPFVRRSQLTGPVASRDAIVLVDTIGELGALWGLADLAFVGGSLDGRRGGQNMIEPAAYGAAVTFGPHVWNFRDTATRLVEAGAAIQVADRDRLEHVIDELLSNDEKRERMGQAARAFVQSQQGATDRALDLVDILIARVAHTDRRAA